MEVLKHNMTDRHMLLVLGMPRSGTSSLAGAIYLLGANLGTNIVPPSPMNPKGYFENRDVVDVDNELLADLGIPWPSPDPYPDGWFVSPEAEKARSKIIEILSRDFTGPGVHLIKMAPFTPIWLPIIEERGFRLKVFHILRHPSEVIASLHYGQGAARGIDPTRAALLWVRTNLIIETNTRRIPRFFIKYDEFVRSPRTILEQGFEAVGLSEFLYDKDLALAEEFVSHHMRHYQAEQLSIKAEPPISDWAAELYDLFPPAGTALDTTAVDRLQAHIYELDSTIKKVGLFDELRFLKKQAMALQTNIAERDRMLAAKTSQISELSNLIEEQKARILELQQRIEQLNERVAKLKTEIEFRDATINALEMDVGKLNAEIKERDLKYGAVQQELQQYLARVQHLETVVESKDKKINALLQELYATNAELERIFQEKQSAVGQLELIQGGKAWRLVQKIRSVRYKLFPPDTMRERVFVKLIFEKLARTFL